LGTWPEEAGVVDDGIEPTEGLGGQGKLLAMGRVGDVAGEGEHIGVGGEFLFGSFEGGGSAGIQEEGPARLGEGPGQGQAEATGGASDEGSA
jgi:hypothetical protein